MKIVSRRNLTIRDVTPLSITSVAIPVKRHLRSPLLAAFDIYKSNVAYGVIQENDALHKEIIAWYQALLELDEDAFVHVPKEITRYVKEGTS